MQMLQNWEKLLRLFPYSKLAQGLTLCRIYAVNLAEPVVFEAGFPPPFEVEHALAAAADFHQEDSALQLECYWDLMQLEDYWEFRPAPVSLWLYGPEFENETTDHIRIEFGLEDYFLPLPDDDASLRASQTNLRSLMHLVQDISMKLPLERKHLWSESGTNFAEKLERAVSGGGSGLALQ